MNEADICDRYVLPKLQAAGWGSHPHPIRREYQFTAGQIVISEHGAQRSRGRIADFVLNYAQDFPIAVVEVKAINKNLESGLQQVKSYAEMLGLQFAYATNGKKIIEFDFSNNQVRELEEFPLPEELWTRLRSFQGLDENKAADYLLTPSAGPQLRSYQIVAVHRTVQAILQKKNRILIVMAPGTGKTLTSFQICWKLWNFSWNNTGKRRRTRILFLTNQSSLVYAAYEAYRAFGDNRYILKERQFRDDKSVYFSTYQIFALESFRQQYSQDFFDLIVADECDRSLMKENSSWRQVLDYFSPAYQLGLAGIFVESENKNLINYFGHPVFTYSLKQGIEDGFLAPFRVQYIQIPDVEIFKPIEIDSDLEILDEEKLFDLVSRINHLKSLETTNFIAQNITDFLKETDRFAKTIIFCTDQQHATAIAQALAKCNEDLVEKFPDYTCSIVSNQKESRSHLENFRDLERLTPVIVTTSKMLLAGVDVPTCKNIVIARYIESETSFLQAISRGLRVREDYEKLFFNVLDFTGSTRLFLTDQVMGTFFSDIPDEEMKTGSESIPSEIEPGETSVDITSDDGPPISGLDGDDEDLEPSKNHLKSLVVNNFKGLTNIELSFQEINVLVGTNNSGKSSVLQVIHFATSISLCWNLVRKLEPSNEQDEDDLVISQEQLIYIPTSNPEKIFGSYKELNYLTIEAKLDSQEKALLNIECGQNRSLLVKLKGRSCIKKLGDIQQPFSIYVPGLAGIPKSESYLSWGSLIRHIARGDSNLILRNVLHYLWIKPERTGWFLFVESLRRIFPNVDIKILSDQKIDEFIDISIIQNNTVLPIDSAGTGFLQTIQILSYIYLFNPSVILLDEPDAHLHPNNQRALTKVLSEIAQERGTQVVIATHSRHILDALSLVNKIWLSYGRAQSCSDSIDVLVDLGALDKVEGLLTKGIKFVVLTEDKKEDLLEKFLLAFAEESDFLVLSYEGCTNILTAKALGKFIRELSPKTQVIIHRDSDFLDETYKEFLREQYKPHSLEVFFTAGVDLESYFCRIEHLLELNSHYEEVVKMVYQELLQECDAELRKKAYEGLMQVQDLKHKAKLGSMSKGECEKFVENLDFSQARWIHGKFFLKRMREKFKQKTKRNLKDCSPTNHLIDPSLKTILGI